MLEQQILRYAINSYFDQDCIQHHTKCTNLINTKVQNYQHNDWSANNPFFCIQHTGSQEITSTSAWQLWRPSTLLNPHTQLAGHEIALIFVAFAKFHIRTVDMVWFASLPFIYFAKINFSIFGIQPVEISKLADFLHELDEPSECTVYHNPYSHH